MPERSTADIATLLVEALQLPMASRAEFLDRACAGNSAQRRDLEALLASHDQAGDFLQRAAMPTGALQARMDGQSGPHSEDVGLMIGRYKLLQLIGEGGFGSVFMAEQTIPVQRRVALKIIKLGMDTRQVIARFEAERQALAIMDHPNIARVLDAGATAFGRPYFVMELVKGEPITEYCDRHRLPLEMRLNLFRQVCAAVQHAHQKGVIHRDIKPSNVLVTLHDGQPQPKVIDFGIAKATSSRLTEKTLFTEFRQLIGTPEYMSPEQAEANATDIDTRSDVYSLGVLLYELLTGSTPFDGKRLRSAAFGELQRIIREEDPPRPSTRLSTIESLPTVASQRAIEPGKLSSKLRGDLDWIVMRAIEKDRTRRYDSASALADDIDRYQRNQPVLAGSPGTVYRARKFVRRHRAQVIAASFIALALLVGSIGTLIGMVRARDSARLAREEASKAQAINAFMSEVLTSVDPDQKGADVRLMEVMGDASRDAATRFADHPELEVQVRLMLAEVYSRLSNSKAAQAELSRVLAIWLQVAGPDDPRAIGVQLRIAGQHAGREETAEAEAVLRDAAPRVARVFKPDSDAAIEVQRLQGMIDMLRGRYDEAERNLLAVRERILAAGDDDRRQLEVLEALIRTQRRRAYDADIPDPALMGAMEPFVRESIERSTRFFGPDAYWTLDSRLRLADIDWQQGRCRDAAETCRAVLQKTQGRYPECSSIRDYAWYVLSFAQNCLGESKEPADIWIKRVDCMRQAGHAETDPVLVGVIADSLRFLERDGRGVEGEVMARKLFDVLTSLGSGHLAMTFTSEMYLARFVSLQGRLDEAETQFRALQAKEADEPSAITRARFHLFLADQRVLQGQFEQAETELGVAATLAGGVSNGTIESHPDDIILGYVNLYSAWNKPEKAAQYRSMREKAWTPTASTSSETR